MSGGLGVSLEAALANGTLIDAILVLVVLEGIALIVVRQLSGRGPAPAQVAAFLASGACLLLALKAALAQAGWVAISAALLCALIAHAVDLWLRWTERRL